MAVLVPGGVAAGNFGQGFPPLVDLLCDLARTHDLTVFSFSPVDQKVAVSLPFAIYDIKSDMNTPFWIKARRVGWRVIRAHRQQRFDVVHGVWGLPAGLGATAMGRLIRRPVIVSLHGGEVTAIPEINYGNLLHPRLRRWLKWTIRYAEVVTTLSEFQRQTMQQNGLPADKVQVVPYGIDPEKFYQANHRAPLRPPYRFVHVANITPVKNQAMLLRVFKRICQHVDARLTIIGPDHMNGQLHRQVTDMGLSEHVAFLGPMPHDRLRDIYHHSHIMLHTSYYEALAVVLAEAAACGVVLAGTRVGLLADLGSEYAVIRECHDDDGLAAGVLRLLSHPERYAQLQRKTRQWALEHPISWTAQKYRHIYDNMLTRLPL